MSQDIAIDGLAILDDSFDVLACFRQSIIGGPDAFVIAVESYEDFAQAIQLKLIREISGQPVALGAGPLRAALEQEAAPLPQVAGAKEIEAGIPMRLQHGLTLADQESGQDGATAGR